MKKEPKETVVPFRTNEEVFAAEDKLMAELKTSENIEDQLTLILMEVHVQKTETDEEDCSGLWSQFARQKAKAILKRFECKPKQK